MLDILACFDHGGQCVGVPASVSRATTAFSVRNDRRDDGGDGAGNCPDIGVLGRGRQLSGLKNHDSLHNDCALYWRSALPSDPPRRQRCRATVAAGQAIERAPGGEVEGVADGGGAPGAAARPFRVERRRGVVKGRVDRRDQPRDEQDLSRVGRDLRENGGVRAVAAVEAENRAAAGGEGSGPAAGIGGGDGGRSSARSRRGASTARPESAGRW
jgi:hypothetical protein